MRAHGCHAAHCAMCRYVGTLQRIVPLAVDARRVCVCALSPAIGCYFRRVASRGLLSQYGTRIGKLLKGGEPDTNAAAKLVLHDWQVGARLQPAGVLPARLLALALFSLVFVDSSQHDVLPQGTRAGPQGESIPSESSCRYFLRSAHHGRR
eukprot:6178219-Pleurochrysis_carterae.AAC.2